MQEIQNVQLAYYPNYGIKYVREIITSLIIMECYEFSAGEYYPEQIHSYILTLALLEHTLGDSELLSCINYY